MVVWLLGRVDTWRRKKKKKKWGKEQQEEEQEEEVMIIMRGTAAFLSLIDNSPISVHSFPYAARLLLPPPSLPLPLLLLLTFPTHGLSLMVTVGVVDPKFFPEIVTD